MIQSACQLLELTQIKYLACILARAGVPARKNYIPDLPPAVEFALGALFSAVAALPAGDFPLPPLSPVGFEPLLDPVVPLPGLTAVGFDPLLEPGPPPPVPALPVPAAGTLAGAIPG